MKVLKLKWKYDHLYFDASSKSKLQMAYLAMVLRLDSDLEVYSTLEEEIEDLSKEVAEILAIKDGDMPILGVFKDKSEELLKALPDKQADLEKYGLMLTWYRQVKNEKLSIIDRAEAARKLAVSRKDFEYEDFAFVEVVNPTESVILKKGRR